eukprot:TRINITY_DN5511_c0_g1_i1.p1 TRINITY_DN5511_c0_g1~~TRINITY_DN5511_c0_g1_i1.p1  ORF type:complete len:384 (-),score=60.53 TRINITY_DN5511_c0_g1_i1:64-1215(-)
MQSPIECSWRSIREMQDHELAFIAKRADMDEKEKRLNYFLRILSSPTINLDILRKSCWHGVPNEVRAICWKLLLGYLPLDISTRSDSLLSSRMDYLYKVAFHFDKIDRKNDALLQQISVDVPRTIGGPIMKVDVVQRMLERILYIWSKEHPHIDYFQGLGDVVAQFLVVYISEHIDVDNYRDRSLRESVWEEIEADTFWSITLALNGMESALSQSNFEGISEMLLKLKSLIRLVDPRLDDHFAVEQLDYIQFGFRWMLCMLNRDLNLSNSRRLWDTYLTEGPESYSSLHVYVCTAFLLRWSDHLKGMEFGDMLTFLQHLPTKDWDDSNIGQIIGTAYSIGRYEAQIRQAATVMVIYFLTMIAVLIAAVAASILSAYLKKKFKL